VELVREELAMDRLVARRTQRGALASLAAAAVVACAASLATLPARADEPARGAAADSLGGAARADSLAPAVPASGEAPVPAAAPPAPAPHVQANAPLTSERMARLTGRPRTVLRTGPSESDAIAGVYPPGQSFPVLARSGDWINVRLSPTASGWVHASLCEEYDDLSGLKMKPNPRLYSRTGSFVAEGYVGGYAFDRKANSLALGARLAYYVFDRIQVETGAGWTHVHRPAEIVESLFGLSLEAEDFNMLFYHLNATYEFLPGRQMVPFATVGVGSSIMQGRSETSFNYGAGTTMFLSKRTGMRWEARDYMFQSGIGIDRRTHNNIEFSIGSLVLF
jgi:outer membrane beta-barrel protein